MACLHVRTAASYGSKQLPVSSTSNHRMSAHAFYSSGEERNIINMNTNQLIKSERGISGMPGEILLYIFKMLVEDSDLSQSRRRYRYPWIFTVVNKQWRHMCLDPQNQTLWRCVDLTTPTTHDQPPDTLHRSASHQAELDQAALEHTSIQLQRSGTAPLIIYAAYICDCSLVALRFKLAAAHCERRQSVTLEYGAILVNYGSHDEFFREHLHLGAGFPMLRDFRYGSHAWFDSTQERRRPLSFPFPDFASLLSLRSVVFLDEITNLAIGDGFPWNQLTDIDLQLAPKSPRRQIYTTFAQCKNLVPLRVMDSCDDDADGMKYESVLLPYVIDLDYHGLVAQPIILRLRPPQLRRAKILAMSDLDAVKTADYLIRRSSCRSNSSNSTSPELGQPFQEDMQRLLELCPFVEGLVLNDVCSIMMRHCDDVLYPLILDQNMPENPPLCPRLKVLHLREIRFTLPTLIQMVDSRLNGSLVDNDTVQKLHKIHWFTLWRDSDHPLLDGEYETSLRLNLTSRECSPSMACDSRINVKLSEKPGRAIDIVNLEDWSLTTSGT